MLDPQTLAVQWQQICREVRGAVALRLSRYSQGTLRMMQDVTERFCSQESPTTDEELACRRIQVSGHTSLLGALAFADLRARTNPESARKQFEALAPICERDLPRTMEEFHALSSEVLSVSSM